MSTYRIEQVDTGENDVWRDLKVMHRECFPSDAMPDATGYWFIVYEDQPDADASPIGFMAIWRGTLLEKSGYLGRMGVLPAARGRGIQRALITHCEEFCRAQGWTLVVTDTVWTNVHSANNFAACGFRQFWPKEGEWASDYALYWRKAL